VASALNIEQRRASRPLSYIFLWDINGLDSEPGCVGGVSVGCGPGRLGWPLAG